MILNCNPMITEELQYVAKKPNIPIPELFGLVKQETIKINYNNKNNTDNTDNNTDNTDNNTDNTDNDTDNTDNINNNTNINETTDGYGVVKLYNFKSKTDIFLKTEEEIQKYLEDNIVNGIIIKKDSHMKPYFKVNIYFDTNTKDSKIQSVSQATANDCVEFVKRYFCDIDTPIRTLKRSTRTINKNGIESQLVEYYIILNNNICTPTELLNGFNNLRQNGEGINGNSINTKKEYKKMSNIIDKFDISIYKENSVIDVIYSILPKNEEVDITYEYQKLQKATLNSILADYIPTYILKDYKNLINIIEKQKTDEEINEDAVKEKSITIREYYDTKAILYLDNNKNILIDEFNKCRKENPRDHNYDIEEYFKKLVDDLFVLDKKKAEIRSYNYKDVVYKPKSDNLNGRLYTVGSVYITMPRFLRHTLAKNIYVDFDIVNCYFVLLLNICIQNNFEPKQYNYIKDFVTNRKKYFETFKNKSRDKIKVVFNCILMDDKFKEDGLDNIVKKLYKQVDEVRNKIVQLDKYEEFKNIVAKIEDGAINTNSKILSRILQFHELEIIKCVMNYLNSNGFTVSSYCYDGLLIEKDERLNNSILTEIKKYTFDNCGFDVDFVFKEMDEALTLPNDYINTPEKYKDVEDDVDACNKFINDYKHILNGMEDAYGGTTKYYKKDNVWRGGNKQIFEEKLINIVMGLNYYQKNFTFDGKAYYSQRFFSKKERIHAISSLISTSSSYITPDFKDKLFKTNLYKICFNNGVYYFKEKLFKPYPVDDVYSIIKIDYDFPERNEEDIEYVKNKILLPIFKKDEEHLNDCMKHIARYMAGHTEDKFYIFNLGLRNSGKGTLEKLLKTSFGDYIGTTNADNFLTKKGSSGDIAKSLSWLVAIQHKRIVITNEISSGQGTQMSGILLKMVASGGDIIEARKNYQDEVQFQIQFGLIFNFNRAPPSIEPFDATESAVVIQNRAAFLSESEINDNNRSYAIPVDINLKNEIGSNPRIRNGFLWYVIDNYKDNKPELKGKLLEDTGSFKASYRYDLNDDDIILKYFKITNDKNDKVFTKDIDDHKNNYLESKYINKKDLIQKLKVLGATFNTKIRIGDKVSCGYTGIQLIEPKPEEDSENE